MPFRFEQVGRRTQPLGYLNFDRAIDRLGQNEFGEQWKDLVKYSPHPFLILGRRHIRFEFDSGTGALVRRQRRRTWTPRPKRLSKLYKKVIEKISVAVQRGQLTLYGFGPQGQTVPAPYRTIVAAQKMRIFYTGTMRTPGEVSQILRVIVLEQEFKQWLENPDHLAQSDKRPVGSQRIIKLLPALVAHVTSRNYQLAKAPFGQFLHEIDKTLSKSGFETVWRQEKLAPIRQGRGKPSNANKKAFEADRSNLVVLLAPSEVSGVGANVGVLSADNL